MTKIKNYLVSLIFAVAMLVGVVTGVSKVYDYGQQHGIELYHEMCYHNNGGFIVDEKTQTVVACQGMGTMPELMQKKKQQPIDNSI